MTTFNATGAAERLHTIRVDGHAPGTNSPGSCLRWQYFAVGAEPNLTPAGIAMDAWTNAPAEHRHPIPTDRPVPKDMIIVLGPSPTRTDHDRNAGDVVVSNGTGIGLDTSVGATDWPYAGVIGNTTLRQRISQTQRPVLGYLTWWLGYDLTGAGTEPASVSTPTPIKISEEDMAVNGFIAPDSAGNIWVCDVLSGTRYNLIANQSSVANAVASMTMYRNAGIKVITDKQGSAAFRGLRDITKTIKGA